MAPGCTTPCGGNMGNVGGAKAATVGGIAGGIYGNAGSIISRGPAVVVTTKKGR